MIRILYDAVSERPGCLARQLDVGCDPRPVTLIDPLLWVGPLEWTSPTLVIHEFTEQQYQELRERLNLGTGYDPMVCFS